MLILLAILFTLVWLGIVFFVVRFVAARSGDQQRATMIAGAAVAVVALIAIWPLSRLFVAPDGAVAGQADAPASGSALTMDRPHDVSAGCRGQARSPEAGGHGEINRVAMGPIVGTPVDIGSAGHVTAAKPLIVAGWATDRGGDRPADGVCLVIDGRIVQKAASIYGNPRPDVAAANGLRYGSLGWEIDLPANSLPSGTHRLEIAVRSSDGSFTLLQLGRKLVVD